MNGVASGSLARIAGTFMVLVLSGWATRVGAQPRPDPDWPCVQRKVPAVDSAAVWSGPDPAAALGDWSKDPEAAALAPRLASRRTSLDEADRLIDEFAKDSGARKYERLTRVFAGTLELVNAERDSILHGIARYARGQHQLADRIRDEADRITALKDSPAVPESKELQDLDARFAWDRRIFEERRQSLNYVCEAPVLLEQRIFEIARRIQRRLSD
jgi:hypothetical protein